MLERRCQWQLGRRPPRWPRGRPPSGANTPRPARCGRRGCQPARARRSLRVAAVAAADGCGIPERGAARHRAGRSTAARRAGVARRPGPSTLSSEWAMPAPAVMMLTCPGVMSCSLPRLSRWITAPSIIQVKVCRPMCGCGPTCRPASGADRNRPGMIEEAPGADRAPATVRQRAADDEAVADLRRPRLDAFDARAHGGRVKRACDVYLAGQHPVERAFVGQLEQPRALLVVQGPLQGDAPLDERAAVRRRAVRVEAQLDLHCAQLPALAHRIHAQGHDGARPEARQQQLVRRRPALAAAIGRRLVGEPFVTALIAQRHQPGSHAADGPYCRAAAHGIARLTSASMRRSGTSHSNATAT